MKQKEELQEACTAILPDVYGKELKFKIFLKQAAFSSIIHQHLKSIHEFKGRNFLYNEHIIDYIITKHTILAQVDTKQS